MITVNGQIEHITYHNKENHYTVAKFRIDQTQHRVSIIGYLANPNPGESLEISGDWQTHPRYGQQFKIESYKMVLPDAPSQIVEYLASGIIEGIGIKMAKRLVDHFGDQALDIIENQPERLLDIPGIGEQKAAQITGSWNIHHALRQLIFFLQENHIPVSYSTKILGAYGSKAINSLQNHPYRAIKDIPGFHFSLVDTLAYNLGISNIDPERIHAGILYLLEQNASDGHMCMFENKLIEKGVKLLAIEQDEMSAYIETMISAGELVRESVLNTTEKAGVFLPEAYQAEKGVASRLRALQSVPLRIQAIDTREIVNEVVKNLAMQPSDEQLNVLQEIFHHRVAIITGGPGTGKTTLIRSITALFSYMGKETLLAAPTGRAARRLSEVTRRKASTIHKLLEFNFIENRFERNEENPLETEAVIIDEVSMVDAFLMFHLLKALPMTSRIILVGDVYQLPSVGPGNVLSDMIHSEAIQTFKLSTIYRQARESTIVTYAHKIRIGEPFDFEMDGELDDRSSFFFIHQSHPEKVVENIVTLCSKYIPEKYQLDPVYDIQVLSPMHNGIVGTMNLNQVLQKSLNPHPLPSQNNLGIFKLGDKVIHLKNNYQKDVFNGDIGLICEIDNRENTLSVNYDGLIVPYDATELDELSLAYAITVHKSQGSEYPAVIVPIMIQHRPLLQRNLLYTAITRGKILVVFIGSRKALDIALKNNKPRQRLTSLAWRLRKG